MSKPSNILRKQAKNIDKALETALNKAFLQALAQRMKDTIKVRTRVGKGVSNSGQLEKLKPLSDLYILQRQKKLGFFTKGGKAIPIVGGAVTNKEVDASTSNKARRKSLKKQLRNNRKYLKENLPNLASSTSAKKSNLTRTGELLDSIVAKVKKSGINSIINITFLGGSRKDGKTNKQVATWVQQQGRPFFVLSKTELTRFTREITKRIRFEINKQLRK